jgi:hypothetical protein
MEKIIEEKIKAAIEAGEFDNLSGQGKPIDLDAYFSTPADLRLGYSVLKSAGCAPPEVELLRELEQLRAKLAATTDERERQSLSKEIEGKQLKLHLMNDSARRKR